MGVIILTFGAITAICVFLFFEPLKSFDPSWLVELAQERYPNDTELHGALRGCKKIKGNYFVSPKNANQSGAEWQFEKNVVLVHPEMGDIVLDILKDGRVGSIEYLGLMCKK